MKIFDSSYFIGKCHFEEHGAQNYLVFQPMYRYFKRIAGAGNGNYSYYWQSKGLSDKRINFIETPNHIITPFLGYQSTKTRVELSGSCFKQNSVIFNHKKVVNICNVYEIGKCINVSNYPAPENFLFSLVTMTKNANIDKYNYYRYWIGFDRHGNFSFNNGLGRNVIIFGVYMSSSIHVDNKGKDILILLIDPTHGIGEHSLTAETICLVSFTERNKKVCLSLHYNGVNNHLFFNGKEIHKLKEKILRL